KTIASDGQKMRPSTTFSLCGSEATTLYLVAVWGTYHISGDRAWFELQKNRKTVGSAILIEGEQFIFKNEELNATILTGKLDYLYRDPWSASLSKVTEYSENGKILEFFRKVTLTEGDILGDTQVKVIYSKPSFEILFTLIRKVLEF
ncbi:MAG: hypothetical protein ACE5J9_07420, partial [Methanosarcinales archaeon]